MPYRKTKRSAETLARMRAGKDRARMDRPAPYYPADLPNLRRRLTVEDYDFGPRVHVLEFYRTRRVDCYRVLVDGREWQRSIGWSRALAGLRKSLPRLGAD